MLVFRYIRSSAPSALMSAVRIVLTVSLGIRSVGSTISTPHHTRQKEFPRAVTDMVTGDFPVDIYVKDVDASNAAPETDILQKTKLWRIGHSSATTPALPPCACPPALPSGAGRPGTGASRQTGTVRSYPQVRRP